MNLKGIKKNKAFKYLMKQQKKTVKASQNQIESIKTIGIIAEEDLFKAYDFTKKLSEDLGINMLDIQVMLYQKQKSEKYGGRSTGHRKNRKTDHHGRGFPDIFRQCPREK